MIGYNRRFSPLTKITKNLLNSYQAKKIFIRYDIHAGQILMTIGSEILKLRREVFREGVHFIDYAYYLINKKSLNITVLVQKMMVLVLHYFLKIIQ